MRLMRRGKLAMSHEETARRYLAPLTPNLHHYLTPHKLANIALCELDMRTRARHARSRHPRAAGAPAAMASPARGGRDTCGG